MHDNLALIISALGKSQTDAVCVAIKAQLSNSTWVESGDNTVLHSKSEGLALTFNVDDILSKIEMHSPMHYFQLWRESF